MVKISPIFLNNTMSPKRDRSTGWQHAKLSGHKNEKRIEELFSDNIFCYQFSKRLDIGSITSHKIGGLHETNVDCVLGNTTKSKSDLVLTETGGRSIHISIKKSCGGQVFLIGVDRFIAGYEKQFSVQIPDDIKASLHLYFCGHPDTPQLLNEKHIIKGESDKLIQYQKRKGRLVWDSLVNYDNAKAERFLQWLKENISNIADFCFARGLAQNQSDWADYVWYKNEVEGENDLDVIFSVDEIKKCVASKTDLIKAGTRNGGSTILLPFGFVQWHQQQMQFHHSYESLCKIVPQK